MERWKWRHGHGDMETTNGKRKTEAQVILLNTLNASLSCNRKFVVFVRLLTKKRTEVLRL
jgi:hypothetical protein